MVVEVIDGHVEGIGVGEILEGEPVSEDSTEVVTNVVDVGLIDVTGNRVIEFVDDTIEVGDASIVESGVVEKVPP